MFSIFFDYFCSFVPFSSLALSLSISLMQNDLINVKKDYASIKISFRGLKNIRTGEKDGAFVLSSCMYVYIIKIN